MNGSGVGEGRDVSWKLRDLANVRDLGKAHCTIPSSYQVAAALLFPVHPRPLSASKPSPPGPCCWGFRAWCVFLARPKEVASY